MTKADSVHSTPQTNLPADQAVSPTIHRRSALKMLLTTAALATASIVPAAAGDYRLLALGREYERLLALRGPLDEEKSRLWDETKRRQIEIVGIDPDLEEVEDEIRRFCAINLQWEEWNEAWEVARVQTGYDVAYDRWTDASAATYAVGEQIKSIAPTTVDGLLVRALVIEHDEYVFELEPADQLLADLRAFAERAKGT